MAAGTYTPPIGNETTNDTDSEDLRPAGTPPPDASSPLFRALFDSSPDGLVLVEPTGRIRLANPAAAALFGVPVDEIAGSMVNRFVPESQRDGHERHVASYVADPARRPMGTGLQLFARHDDGSLVPVEISLSPVTVDDESYVLAALRDVTERQEARSSLALLEERERIARDLHDMVIQRVFAAGLSLQAVQSMIDSPVARDRIAEVADELDETIRELRSAIFRLGRVDADRSLRQRLHAVVEERSRVLGFDPEVEVDGSLDDVPDHVAEQFVATLTESLSNVARHAGATRAHVLVSRDDADLHLTVADDGRGLSEHPKPHGGVANMMWRAAELGGRCAIEPNDPHGTRVVWRVPL